MHQNKIYTNYLNNPGQINPPSPLPPALEKLSTDSSRKTLHPLPLPPKTEEGESFYCTFFDGSPSKTVQ